MIRIAVCEDDKSFSDALANQMEKFFKANGFAFCISQMSDGHKLIEWYRRQDNPFDLIVLDINMPAMNGKDVAKALRNMDSTFKLIFISSYENEVFNCFEYDVLDFIPKHLVNEHLDRALKRAVDAIEDKRLEYHFFEVRKENKRAETIKVLLDDILYFECINKKVYVYLKKQTFLLAKYTWNQIENKYGGYNFTVPHRGYLVHVKFIAVIKDTQIELDNGVLIPLGRRNRRSVEQMLLHMLE